MNGTRVTEHVRCVRCGSAGTAPAGFGGEVTCPKCGAVVPVGATVFVPSGRSRRGFGNWHPFVKVVAVMAGSVAVTAAVAVAVALAVPRKGPGAPPAPSEAELRTALAGEASALISRGLAEEREGRYEAMVRSLLGAVEMMNRLGFADGAGPARGLLAKAHFDLGRGQLKVNDLRGLGTIRDGIRLKESSTPTGVEMGARVVLAHMYTMYGMADESRAVMAEAVQRVAAMSGTERASAADDMVREAESGTYPPENAQALREIAGMVRLDGKGGVWPSPPGDRQPAVPENFAPKRVARVQDTEAAREARARKAATVSEFNSGRSQGQTARQTRPRPRQTIAGGTEAPGQ